MPFLKYPSYNPKEFTVECIREFYGEDVFTNMGGANGLREAKVVRVLLKHIEKIEAEIEQLHERERRPDNEVPVHRQFPYMVRHSQAA